MVPLLAAGTEAFPGSSYLVQLGVAGIVLLLIFIGWLWPKPAVDDLKKDLERLRSQVDGLMTDWLKVMPLLDRTNETLMRLKEEESKRQHVEERQKWEAEREEEMQRRTRPTK